MNTRGQNVYLIVRYRNGYTRRLVGDLNRARTKGSSKDEASQKTNRDAGKSAMTSGIQGHSATAVFCCSNEEGPRPGIDVESTEAASGG